MADRNIIKLGIDADVQTLIKKLKKEFASVKDFGLSDAVEGQINDIVAMLDGLGKSLTDVIGTKIDTKTFAVFEKKSTEEIKIINQRVDRLEDAVKGLIITMDSANQSKFQSFLDGIKGGVTSVTDVVEHSTDAIKGLLDIASKSGGKIQLTDNSTLTNLQKEEKILERIKKVADDLVDEKEYDKSATWGKNKKLTSALSELKEAYEKLQNAKEAFESSDTSNTDDLGLARIKKNYAEAYAYLKSLREQFDFSFGVEVANTQIPNEIHEVLRDYQDEIEQFAQWSENRLRSVSELQYKINKQAAISVDKDENGKRSIKVPMDISTTGRGLAEKARRVLDVAQRNLSDKPLKVDFAFQSHYSSRKTNDLLKEWQEQIGNIDSPELRAKFEELYDTIAKDFQKEIKINVTSDINDEEVKVKNTIEKIKKLVGSKIHIFPEFDIKEVDVEKLQKKVDRIAKQLKLNVELFPKGAKDQSNAQLEALNALSDMLKKNLEGLNKNYLSNIKKSLADILSLAQTLKDSAIKTDAPIDELVNSVKDLTVAFQQAFGLFDKEDLDGIFERMQNSVKGIRGNLEGTKEDNPLVAQLHEILDLYKEYQRLGGTNTLADIGGTKKVQKWLADNYAEDVSSMSHFKAEGKNASAGYAEGIREGIPDVEAAATEMAEAALEAVRKTQDSNSPSKRFKKLGKDGAKGYGQGWLESADEIKKSVSEAIDAGVNVGEESVADVNQILEKNLEELKQINNKRQEEVAKILEEQKPIDEWTQNTLAKNAEQFGLDKISKEVKEITEESSKLVNFLDKTVDGSKEFAQNVDKTADAIERVSYHYGNLSNGKPSHQFGEEITAWFNGIRNGGRGWADGTGTYTTSDINQYKNGDFSDDLKKFYAIDTSKLKLYEQHAEEDAQKYFDFSHHLEQLCIKMGSGFSGFDENLKDITPTTLYKDFQKLFADSSLTFDEFNKFIQDMSALVKESGLKVNGTFAPRKLLAFKKNHGVDDIKTRFLKQLGYQGTDFSGTSFDSLRDGSVIFADAEKKIIKSGKNISDVFVEVQQQSIKTDKAVDSVQDSVETLGKTDGADKLSKSIENVADNAKNAASAINEVFDNSKETNTLEGIIKKFSVMSKENQALNPKDRREQFAYTNMNSMFMTGVRKSTSANTVYARLKEELLNSLDKSVRKDLDTYIHSHPEKRAVFSPQDIESAIARAEQNMMNSIVVSFDEIAMLDLSGLNKSQLSKFEKTFTDTWTNKLKELTTVSGDRLKEKYGDKLENKLITAAKSSLESALDKRDLDKGKFDLSEEIIDYVRKFIKSLSDKSMNGVDVSTQFGKDIGKIFSKKYGKDITSTLEHEFGRALPQMFGIAQQGTKYVKEAQQQRAIIIDKSLEKAGKQGGYKTVPINDFLKYFEAVGSYKEIFKALPTRSDNLEKDLGSIEEFLQRINKDIGNVTDSSNQAQKSVEQLKETVKETNAVTNDFKGGKAFQEIREDAEKASDAAKETKKAIDSVKDSTEVIGKVDGAEELSKSMIDVTDNAEKAANTINDVSNEHASNSAKILNDMYSNLGNIVLQIDKNANEAAAAISLIVASAEKLEKVDSPFAGTKAWSSLNRRRKNETAEDSIAAKNIQTFSRVYQQTGQKAILDVIKDYASKSNLNDQLKKRVQDVLSSAIKTVEKTIETTLKEGPQTKTVTMTNKELKEYLKKYALWGQDEELFNYNFKAQKEAMQKDGRAYRPIKKNGKLGGWLYDVEVPVNQLSKVEEKVEDTSAALKQNQQQAEKTSEALNQVGTTGRKRLDKVIGEYRILYQEQQNLYKQMSPTVSENGEITIASNYTELATRLEEVTNKMQALSERGFNNFKVNLRDIALGHKQATDAAIEQAKAEEQIQDVGTSATKNLKEELTKIVSNEAGFNSVDIAKLLDLNEDTVNQRVIELAFGGASNKQIIDEFMLLYETLHKNEEQAKETNEALSDVGTKITPSLQKHIDKYQELYKAQQDILSSMSAMATTSSGRIENPQQYKDLKSAYNSNARQMQKESERGYKNFHVNLRELALGHTQVAKAAQAEAEAEAQVQKADESIVKTNITPTLQKKIDEYKELQAKLNELYSKMSPVPGQTHVDTEAYKKMKAEVASIEGRMSKLSERTYKNHNGQSLRDLALGHTQIAKAAQSEAQAEMQVQKAEETVVKTNITKSLQKKIDEYKELQTRLNELYSKMCPTPGQTNVDTESYKQMKREATSIEGRMRKLVERTYKNHNGQSLKALADGDANISSSSAKATEEIQKTANAINKEGEAANKGVQKKEKLAKAEKKLAEGSKDAAENTEDAAGAIEEESKKAEQQAQYSQKIWSRVDKNNQQRLDDAIAGYNQTNNSNFQKRFIPELQSEIESLRMEFQRLQAIGESGELIPVDELDIAKKTLQRLKTEVVDTNKYFAESKDVSGLYSKITGFMGNNTAMSKKFKNELEDILVVLKSGSDLTEAEFKQLTTNFNNISGKVKELGQTGNSLFASFKKQLTSANAQFLTTYFSLQDWIRYIRQAVSTVQELDYALIDLRKTTTMSSDELNEFYYGANETAKELGVTTKQIIEQAAAWSRLGYSSKESATEMAALSSQFKQISPGMSLDTATDGLVSTMKAKKCLYVQ